jgi:hypothetical protein
MSLTGRGTGCPPFFDVWMLSFTQRCVVKRVTRYDTIGKTCATLHPTTITWHHRGQAITISLQRILKRDAMYLLWDQGWRTFYQLCLTSAMVRFRPKGRVSPAEELVAFHFGGMDAEFSAMVCCQTCRIIPLRCCALGPKDASYRLRNWLPSILAV